MGPNGVHVEVPPLLKHFKEYLTNIDYIIILMYILLYYSSTACCAALYEYKV